MTSPMDKGSTARNSSGLESPDVATGGTVVHPGDSPGDRWVVVLAGGHGTRVQGFIREILGSEWPKQFCRIIGTRSMLRHTWDRALQVVPTHRIVTVITAGQEKFLDEEARHSIPGTVLVQPANKETGPGLLLPLLWIARRNPAAKVVVFPADHFVWEETRFVAHVQSALEAVAHLPDRLILLGVEADGPEQGYGWIAPGDPLDTGQGPELYVMRRFWEKPDRRTAVHLFASGYLWNTLVLAGRLEAYLKLADACVPEVLAPLRTVVECLDALGGAAALAAGYNRIRTTNLSRSVLARQPEALLVLPARGIYWSDWGDPGRIVTTVRRFNWRPAWLLTYARTMARGGRISA